MCCSSEALLGQDRVRPLAPSELIGPGLVSLVEVSGTVRGPKEAAQGNWPRGFVVEHRRHRVIAELRKGLLPVSCIALTGACLCIAAGCNHGEEDGHNRLPTPPDVSTESSWTRCPTFETGSDESLHASALTALVPSSPNLPGPCAFGGCHNEAGAKAQLKLSPDAPNLRALMVGIPACEVML